VSSVTLELPDKVLLVNININLAADFSLNLTVFHIASKVPR
jgi:hypothetical protein